MTLSPLWVGVGVPSSPTLVCVHVLGKGFIPLIIFTIIMLSLQVLPSVTIDPVMPTTTNKCVETESACNGIVKVSPMNCKQLRSHTHALCKQCINYFFYLWWYCKHSCTQCTYTSHVTRGGRESVCVCVCVCVYSTHILPGCHAFSRSKGLGGFSIWLFCRI